MSSYEEWVVDREVEAAWLQFKVRLADHLAAMNEGDLVELAVAGPDDSVVVKTFFRREGSDRLSAHWTWTDKSKAVSRAAHLKPVKLRVHSIDAVVCRIGEVLRDDIGVHHPAFVTVTQGNLALVEPPHDLVAPVAPVAPLAMPDMIVPESHEDLRNWVDRVVGERIGGTPRKGKDGDITLDRPEGRVLIGLDDSKPVIEVWAAVARNVDVRRARKQVARLNSRFHFFRFALLGDHVIISTSVNAMPLCPAHLNRAIDSTLDYLQVAAPRLQAKLARREPVAATEDVLQGAIDPDLLLLFGASEHRDVMVELAREIAGGRLVPFVEWKRAALDFEQEIKLRLATRVDDEVREALMEQVDAWHRVSEAMGYALRTDITWRRDRREASS